MNNTAPVSVNNGSNIISIGAPQEQQEDTNANIAQLNNANGGFAQNMQLAPSLHTPKYIQAKQIYGVDATLSDILLYKKILLLLKKYTHIRKVEVLKIANPNTIKEYKKGKKDCIKKIINYCFKKADINDLKKFSNIIDRTLQNKKNAYLEKSTLEKLAKILEIEALYESLLFLTLGKENDNIYKTFDIKIVKRQIILAFMEYIMKEAPACGFSRKKSINIYQALLTQSPALLFRMHLYEYNYLYLKKKDFTRSVHLIITLLPFLFKNEKGNDFSPFDDQSKPIYDKLFCRLNSLVNSTLLLHESLSSNNISVSDNLVVPEINMKSPEPILFGSYRFMIVCSILRILIEEKYYINGDAEFTSNFLNTIQQNMQQLHPNIARVIENYQATLFK